MIQDPPRGTRNSSAGQEIPHLVLKLKVYFCVLIILPLKISLGQFNTVHGV